ncbi:hypothetical protein COOONC_08006 [Cooperia oncophora]
MSERPFNLTINTWQQLRVGSLQMKEKDGCPGFQSNITHNTPGRWFKFANGFMTAIIGDVDKSTRGDVINAIGDPDSTYYYVGRYLWSDVSVAGYKKSRRKPHRVRIGFIVLTSVAIVSCYFMVIFWKGLTGIQSRDPKEEIREDSNYLDHFEDTVECGIDMAQTALLNEFHKQKSEENSKVSTESQISDLLRSSRAKLTKLANLTANCNQSEVVEVHNYSQYLEKNEAQLQKLNEEESKKHKVTDEDIISTVKTYRDHVSSVRLHQFHKVDTYHSRIIFS